MIWKFCSVFLFVLVVCISGLDARRTKAADYEKAAVQMKTFLDVHFPNEFKNIDLVGMISNGLSCTACLAFTDVLNTKRIFMPFNRFFTDLLLKNFACPAIAIAGISSVKECQGLIDMYSDQLLYIINNVKNNKLICPILLQGYDCQDVKHPEYTINLNSDAPKEKRVSSYNPEDPALRVLQITDVHFDPDYKAGSNAKCSEHLCCMASSGTVRKTEDRAGYWTDYRECDIPGYFIEDAFGHMSKNDKFDYIYFTGDIIAHKLWATSRTGNLRTMKQFWTIFKNQFPDHQDKVFPILGNHEPHPCNLYAPDSIANGKFSVQWLFNGTADLWKDFLPEEALETVRKGGYYSVSPEKGFRIIAINSNIGYYFNFWLILDDADPFGQLAWLAEELQKAEDNNEVVHLLSHVAPGLDLINSWARHLRYIIRRYHNIIGGIFIGHTHVDEYNLYYSIDGTPISVSYNGGSLTPYFDVNPNYKIYNVDPTSYDILDIETYMVNLTEANMDTKTSPRWQPLYSLTQEYDLPNASPQSMHQLVERLVKEPEIRDKYFKNSVRYGTPSLKNGCDKECHNALVCKIVTTVYADKTLCNNLNDQMVFGRN